MFKKMQYMPAHPKIDETMGMAILQGPIPDNWSGAVLHPVPW
jgi:hypothetical protein